MLDPSHNIYKEHDMGIFASLGVRLLKVYVANKRRARVAAKRKRSASSWLIWVLIGLIALLVLLASQNSP